MLAPPAQAALLGTNPPARPLTLSSIRTLPAAQQPAWIAYLKQSTAQWQTDQAFLQAEMRRHHVKQPIIPPAGHSAKCLPLDRTASWYGADEARRIADIVVSFQTPAGGWSKNLDLTQHPRAPGESFAPNNNSRYLGNGDFDVARDATWDYVGTFDNDATTTELHFLAKVISAADANRSGPWRTAFLRGLDYIFAAQYPNGGWPQVWPLQGGYHDAITHNDDAMLNVLTLLREVAETNAGFGFVPEKYRSEAAASLQRGIACVVATQIVANGRRTVWCQQHDALTLQPASARNFEMPAAASSESADLVNFLMADPHPTPEIIAAVDAAAAWFEKTRIYNVAFKFGGKDGRRLVAKPGNGPLWARYYQIGTDRPIFGDRDKSIHDDVNEISRERRDGYSWFTEDPESVLKRYTAWKSRLAG